MKAQNSNSRTGFLSPAPCPLLLASCLLLSLLTACGGMAEIEGEPLDQATPTISSYFAGVQAAREPQTGGVPTLSSRFAGTTIKPESASGALSDAPTPVSYFARNTPYPTSTPRPTRTPWPTPPPATLAPLTETLMGGVPVSPQLTLAPIYTDALTAGWGVTESWGVQLDLQDTAYVHEGEFALAVTPEEDYGSLFFTVIPGSSRVYPYDHTLGARFWLNSGAAPLYLDQLAVTVVGSNAYTYWRDDDDSVEIEEDESFFSETRLYYLGLNRTLPAETWVEVVVWLDDLPFDPDYTYVTGIYVKSDAGLRQTFYVDEMALVMAEE